MKVVHLKNRRLLLFLAVGFTISGNMLKVICYGSLERIRIFTCQNYTVWFANSEKCGNKRIQITDCGGQTPYNTNINETES